MNEAQTKPVIGGLAGWQARTIRQLTVTHLRDTTVASLAQAVNLSPFHFSRAFRATFGIPPREWLLQQRLEHAKARLLDGSETVEQIAVSVGYRSGSQFSRAFRARVGTSPQAFRRA